MSRSTFPLLCLATLLSAACVTIFQSGQVELTSAAALSEPRQVHSPMKAFFLDGSTVLYPSGATITHDSILGPGTRHPMGPGVVEQVMSVSLDSLVGIEAFQGQTNAAASIAASAGLTALTAVGTIALLKALFGSCPTFYASSEGGSSLQSEAFSYSIAPLLEARDLDALSIVPDTDGILRLELRNEALETHYINHLELMAIDHAPEARVIPDALGLPVAVAGEVGATVATDREGRDVTAILSATGDDVYSSPATRIATADNADPDDFIELRFPHPRTSEAVLTLRLRNSLLNTVLFYDMMLGQAGAGALDWIGQDMARISTLVEMGTWFQNAMGLRVDVLDNGQWIEVARLTDTGPIAWEEVGVRLPVPSSQAGAGSDELRVRLRFLTDAWRLDRAALGEHFQAVGTATLPVARFSAAGAIDPGTADRLARPDETYLATYPGTSIVLEFDPPPVVTGTDRSFILVSQGYYTEWVRRDWIREADQPIAFRPDDTTIETLMALWLAQKDQFEREFHASRIPVR